MHNMVADEFNYGLGAEWNTREVTKPGKIAEDTIARVRESLLWHAQIGLWGEPKITVSNKVGGHNPMREITYEFDGTTVRHLVMVIPINYSPIAYDLVGFLKTGVLPVRHGVGEERSGYVPQHFGLMTRIDAKGEGSRIPDTLMAELRASGWT